MQSVANTKRKRIAVCAQSFGFGPVSKASAIAQALHENYQELDILFIANSVSKEFIKREGLWKDSRDFTVSDNMVNMVNELKHYNFRNIDAALVVLDPELASFFQPWVFTYFVDSLGFMWDENFFDTYPRLRHTRMYFVQDIFNAHTKLAAKGVKNLYSVGAILNKRAGSSELEHSLVFHLGGLLNIFDPAPVHNYVRSIVPIAEKLSSGPTSLLLASRHAYDSFEELRTTKLCVRDLSHDQTLGAFTNSSAVFTSPGLTTLLELMHLRVPTVPLPPQNMSQALIINNLVTYWEAAPDIWKFLAKYYPLTAEVNEKEGVSMVQSINEKTLCQPLFQKTYIELAREAQSQLVPLPNNLVPDTNGVHTICTSIYQDLLLTTSR